MACFLEVDDTEACVDRVLAIDEESQFGIIGVGNVEVDNPLGTEVVTADGRDSLVPRLSHVAGGGVDAGVVPVAVAVEVDPGEEDVVHEGHEIGAELDSIDLARNQLGRRLTEGIEEDDTVFVSEAGVIVAEGVRIRSSFVVPVGGRTDDAELRPVDLVAEHIDVGHEVAGTVFDSQRGANGRIAVVDLTHDELVVFDFARVGDAVVAQFPVRVGIGLRLGVIDIFRLTDDAEAPDDPARIDALDVGGIAIVDVGDEEVEGERIVAKDVADLDVTRGDLLRPGLVGDRGAGDGIGTGVDAGVVPVAVAVEVDPGVKTSRLEGHVAQGELDRIPLAGDQVVVVGAEPRGDVDASFVLKRRGVIVVSDGGGVGLPIVVMVTFPARPSAVVSAEEGIVDVSGTIADAESREGVVLTRCRIVVVGSVAVIDGDDFVFVILDLTGVGDAVERQGRQGHTVAEAVFGVVDDTEASVHLARIDVVRVRHEEGEGVEARLEELGAVEDLLAPRLINNTCIGVGSGIEPVAVAIEVDPSIEMDVGVGGGEGDLNGRPFTGNEVDGFLAGPTAEDDAVFVGIAVLVVAERLLEEVDLPVVFPVGGYGDRGRTDVRSVLQQVAGTVAQTEGGEGRKRDRIAVVGGIPIIDFEERELIVLDFAGVGDGVDGESPSRIGGRIDAGVGLVQVFGFADDAEAGVYVTGD